MSDDKELEKLFTYVLAKGKHEWIVILRDFTFFV